MKSKKLNRLIDVLLISAMILPFIGAIVLSILTKPASEGIVISGAQIYFTLDMPLQPLQITEAHVVSLCVVNAIFFLCIFLTRGLRIRGISTRQAIAEKLVCMAEDFVRGNMGEQYVEFAAFMGSVMAISAMSSLCSLLGLYPPTADVSIIGGWALIVFVLITHYKLKGGVLSYLKSFTEPIFIFTPFNVIGELSTPVSMTLRHYGNVLSGVVISTLLAAAFSGASKLLLGWIPGGISEIPLLRIGIPAILSLYFDIFSGLLQAFIFAILTALYISNGAPEGYDPRVKNKKHKNKSLKKVK
jgi:F-type H+-transporting ATPase subunit a